jgi:hypothetical protein
MLFGVILQATCFGAVFMACSFFVVVVVAAMSTSSNLPSSSTYPPHFTFVDLVRHDFARRNMRRSLLLALLPVVQGGTPYF